MSMGPSGNHVTLRASGTQQIGTHHLVVLVLEHMAVPNVAPWFAVERDDNSSDLSGRAEDRVLPASLFPRGWCGFVGHDYFGCTLVPEDIERTAIQQLKMNCV